MTSTLNMQDMRYLNLFRKVSHIETRFCFKYNEMIVFCVPKKLLSKAIGENASNIKKISKILTRRIRIIPSPRGIEDAKEFFEHIVNPVTFKDISIDGDEITITAGSQSKAALIGRNKRRLIELQKIAGDYFQKELKIA